MGLNDLKTNINLLRSFYTDDGVSCIESERRKVYLTQIVTQLLPKYLCVNDACLHMYRDCVYVLFQACNDTLVDVRIVARESLYRLIRASRHRQEFFLTFDISSIFDRLKFHHFRQWRLIFDCFQIQSLHQSDSSGNGILQLIIKYLDLNDEFLAQELLDNKTFMSFCKLNWSTLSNHTTLKQTKNLLGLIHKDASKNVIRRSVCDLLFYLGTSITSKSLRTEFCHSVISDFVDLDIQELNSDICLSLIGCVRMILNLKISLLEDFFIKLYNTLLELTYHSLATCVTSALDALSALIDNLLSSEPSKLLHLYMAKCEVSTCHNQLHPLKKSFIWIGQNQVLYDLCGRDCKSVLELNNSAIFSLCASIIVRFLVETDAFKIRISSQASALSLLSRCLCLLPQFVHDSIIFRQKEIDIFKVLTLYLSHEDPLLRANVFKLFFVTLQAADNSPDEANVVLNNCYPVFIKFPTLLNYLIKGLQDKTPTVCVAALDCVQFYIQRSSSCQNTYLLKYALFVVFSLVEHNYWLVRISVCDFLTNICWPEICHIFNFSHSSFTVMDISENQDFIFQHSILLSVNNIHSLLIDSFLTFLCDPDIRVWTKAVDCLINQIGRIPLNTSLSCLEFAKLAYSFGDFAVISNISVENLRFFTSFLLNRLMIHTEKQIVFSSISSLHSLIDTFFSPAYHFVWSISFNPTSFDNESIGYTLLFLLMDNEDVFLDLKLQKYVICFCGTTITQMFLINKTMDDASSRLIGSKFYRILLEHIFSVLYLFYCIVEYPDKTFVDIRKLGIGLLHQSSTVPDSDKVDDSHDNCSGLFSVSTMYPELYQLMQKSFLTLITSSISTTSLLVDLFDALIDVLVCDYSSKRCGLLYMQCLSQHTISTLIEWFHVLYTFRSTTVLRAFTSIVISQFNFDATVLYSDCDHIPNSGSAYFNLNNYSEFTQSFSFLFFSDFYSTGSKLPKRFDCKKRASVNYLPLSLLSGYFEDFILSNLKTIHYMKEYDHVLTLISLVHVYALCNTHFNFPTQKIDAVCFACINSPLFFEDCNKHFFPPIGYIVSRAFVTNDLKFLTNLFQNINNIPYMFGIKLIFLLFNYLHMVTSQDFINNFVKYSNVKENLELIFKIRSELFLDTSIFYLEHLRNDLKLTPASDILDNRFLMDCVLRIVRNNVQLDGIVDISCLISILPINYFHTEFFTQILNSISDNLNSYTFWISSIYMMTYDRCSLSSVDEIFVSDHAIVFFFRKMFIHFENICQRLHKCLYRECIIIVKIAMIFFRVFSSFLKHDRDSHERCLFIKEFQSSSSVLRCICNLLHYFLKPSHIHIADSFVALFCTWCKLICMDLHSMRCLCQATLEVFLNPRNHSVLIYRIMKNITLSCLCSQLELQYSHFYDDEDMLNFISWIIKQFASDIIRLIPCFQGFIYTVIISNSILSGLFFDTICSIFDFLKTDGLLSRLIMCFECIPHSQFDTDCLQGICRFLNLVYSYDPAYVSDKLMNFLNRSDTFVSIQTAVNICWDTIFQTSDSSLFFIQELYISILQLNYLPAHVIKDFFSNEKFILVLKENLYISSNTVLRHCINIRKVLTSSMYNSSIEKKRNFDDICVVSFNLLEKRINSYLSFFSQNSECNVDRFSSINDDDANQFISLCKCLSDFYLNILQDVYKDLNIDFVNTIFIQHFEFLFLTVQRHTQTYNLRFNSMFSPILSLCNRIISYYVDFEAKFSTHFNLNVFISCICRTIVRYFSIDHISDLIRVGIFSNIDPEIIYNILCYIDDLYYKNIARSSEARSLLIKLCRFKRNYLKFISLEALKCEDSVLSIHDILRRALIVGWSNKHQFEEIWVFCLFLISSDREIIINSDIYVAINCLALRSLTGLLLKQLFFSNVHSQYEDSSSHDFSNNIFDVFSDEREYSNSKYFSNQLENLCKKVPFSINWCTIMACDTNVYLDLVETSYNINQVTMNSLLGTLHGADRRSTRILSHGLNLNSAYKFLMELITYWCSLDPPILPLIMECIRSLLYLTDLHIPSSVDASLVHFLYELTDYFLFDESVCYKMSVDEICHSYLLLAHFKCLAILNKNEDTGKLSICIQTGLDHVLISSRLLTVHCCLYLLQLGPAFVSDSFLTILLDFLYSNASAIYDLDSVAMNSLLFALLIYIMENYRQSLVFLTPKYENFFCSCISCLNTHLSNVSTFRMAAILLKSVHVLYMASTLTVTNVEGLILTLSRTTHDNVYACFVVFYTLYMLSPLFHGTLASSVVFTFTELSTHLLAKIDKYPEYTANVLLTTLCVFMERFASPSWILMNRVLTHSTLSIQPPYSTHPFVYHTILLQTFRFCHCLSDYSLLPSWLLINIRHLISLPCRNVTSMCTFISLLLAYFHSNTQLDGSLSLFHVYLELNDTTDLSRRILCELIIRAFRIFYNELSVENRLQLESYMRELFSSCENRISSL